jgi:hypothetical protein
VVVEKIKLGYPKISKLRKILKYLFAFARITFCRKEWMDQHAEAQRAKVG